MALDRKALRLALRDALAERMAGSGIKEFLSRDIQPSSTAQDRFPLLVVNADTNTPDAAERVRPPIWHLGCDVVIYVRPNADEPDPDGLLDDLETELEAALEALPDESDAGWWTTLGGLCSRAYPSGEVQRYSAGNECWLVFPVELVAPTGHRGVP